MLAISFIFLILVERITAVSWQLEIAASQKPRDRPHHVQDRGRKPKVNVHLQEWIAHSADLQVSLHDLILKLALRGLTVFDIVVYRYFYWDTTAEVVCCSH